MYSHYYFSDVFIITTCFYSVLHFSLAFTLFYIFSLCYMYCDIVCKVLLKDHTSIVAL